jgi:hypothetical protein
MLSFLLEILSIKVCAWSANEVVQFCRSIKPESRAVVALFLLFGKTPTQPTRVKCTLTRTSRLCLCFPLYTLTVKIVFCNSNNKSPDFGLASHMSNRNPQSGLPSTSTGMVSSMANHIDNASAVQETEELWELAIATHYRKRTSEHPAPVSDGEQSTSRETDRNDSGKYILWGFSGSLLTSDPGLPPRTTFLVLEASHGEPSNLLLASASKTAFPSRYSNQAMIEPGTQFDRVGQSSRFVDTSSGKAAIWTRGKASSELTNHPTAHAIDGAVERVPIPSANDDFLAAPSTNTSSIASAASLQFGIFSERQPYPPPASPIARKVGFGRFRSQTYPPAGNNVH